MSALTAERVTRHSRSFHGLSAEGLARLAPAADAARAIEQAPQRSESMQDARRMLASWLQRCLRQGAQREHPRAVAALPMEAIVQHVQRAVDLHGGAPDAVAMQPGLTAEFGRIDGLVTQLAAACKSLPETLCLYDELVDRGLAALQQLAEIEIALNAHQAWQVLHARFSAGVVAMEAGKTTVPSLEDAESRLDEAKPSTDTASGPACGGACDA